MKRILFLMISFLIVFYNMSFAHASKEIHNQMTKGESNRSENDIFYDDFTLDTIGKFPNNYAIALNNCEAFVDEAKLDEEKKKKCFILYDTQNTGNKQFLGPYAYRNYEEQTDIIALEFRFKLVKTKTDIVPISIHIRHKDSRIASIGVYPDDGVLYFQDVPLLGNTPVPLNTWIKIRMVVDFNNRKTDVSVTSDYLKNTNLKSTGTIIVDKDLGQVTRSNVATNAVFDGEFTDNVEFRMGKWEGKVCIDYVKMEKDATRLGNTNVTGIKPPLVSAIPNVPSGKYLNILNNNNYIFLGSTPIINNSKTYIYYNNLNEFENIKIDETASLITITKGENKVQCDKKKNIITNNINNESEKFILNNDKIYIPLRYVFVNLGYVVDWADETKTIILSEKLD